MSDAPALADCVCPKHGQEEIIRDNNLNHTHIKPYGPPERVSAWPEVRCGVCGYEFWKADEPTLVKSENND